ncbi:MAG: LCP family protein [Candidatus Daviesbacteria bacterium]|nr:LCP family protein [Candidatus Daviesbacteria bacterium]
MEEKGAEPAMISRRQFFNLVKDKAPAVITAPFVLDNILTNQTTNPPEINSKESEDFLEKSTSQLSNSILSLSPDKKQSSSTTTLLASAAFLSSKKDSQQEKLTPSDPFFGNTLELLLPEIEDPFFGGGLELLLPDLEETKGKKEGVLNKLWTRRQTIGALGAGLITATALSKLTIPTVSEYMKKVFNTVEAEAVEFDPNKIFPPVPTPIPGKKESKPIQKPNPEKPKPLPTPEKPPKEIVGNKNLAEFFLGDLLEKFKTRRQERVKNPDAAERINKELLGSDSIFTVYMGIDETRDRPKVFSSVGWGRSDIVLLTAFNIHTFQTKVVSIPRDLFAPELAKYFPKDPKNPNAAPPKVNSMTTVEYAKSIGNIKESVNEYELIKKIIESATGCPIDMMVKTNIDFMQGSWDRKIPGIFDRLTPNGIDVLIPESFTDKEYPTPGEGDETIFFEKGWQTLSTGKYPKRAGNPGKGGYTNPDTVSRNITAYARSRKGDSDFARSDRQRQILSASLKAIMPDVLKDLTAGSSKSLDTIVSALEGQKQAANLFFDVDIIEIVKTLNANILKLRQTANGTAALGVLIANTAGVVSKISKDDKNSFVSYGPTFTDGLDKVDEKDPNFWFAESKPAGSSTSLPPTQLGNYLSYWAPLRNKVMSIMKN